MNRDEAVAAAIRSAAGHVNGQGIRIDATELERILGETFDAGAVSVRPSTDRENVQGAIGNVLVNARNYPSRVGKHILGQDMAPLIEMVTDAVLPFPLGVPQPLTTTREALARALYEIHPWAPGYPGSIEPVKWEDLHPNRHAIKLAKADALLASGVLVERSTVEAEALEEAADELGLMESWSAAGLRARAAVKREESKP